MEHFAKTITKTKLFFTFLKEQQKFSFKIFAKISVSVDVFAEKTNKFEIWRIGTGNLVLAKIT